MIIIIKGNQEGIETCLTNDALLMVLMMANRVQAPALGVIWGSIGGREKGWCGLVTTNPSLLHI